MYLNCVTTISQKHQKRNGTALFVKNDIEIEGFQEHCGRGWSIPPF